MFQYHFVETGNNGGICLTNLVEAVIMPIVLHLCRVFAGGIDASSLEGK